MEECDLGSFFLLQTEDGIGGRRVTGVKKGDRQIWVLEIEKQFWRQKERVKWLHSKD